jgi:hypothetical protein
MIRSRPIFLCLNRLEAKLVAKALRFTTSHIRAEFGFVEWRGQRYKKHRLNEQAMCSSQNRTPETHTWPRLCLTVIQLEWLQ